MQQQADIREKTRYKIPKQYKVIMYNDDYTTMDFVVMVLEKVFHKTRQDAESIMLKIHNEGMAIVGVYTYDMARTKVSCVNVMAQDNGFPLKVTYQEE